MYVCNVCAVLHPSIHPSLTLHSPTDSADAQRQTDRQRGMQADSPSPPTIHLSLCSDFSPLSVRVDESFLLVLPCYAVLCCAVL
mmetsp:Transcript_4619/g.12324  ORF Transcript_4619/g.12324 Transcript_4619/m.12324 type:complete len:84 (-) Transcript_4619:1666-1917(-)